MRRTSHIGIRLDRYRVNTLAYRLTIYTPVLPYPLSRRRVNLPVLIPV